MRRLLLLPLLALGVGASAQPTRVLASDAWCDRDGGGSRRAWACEVRETVVQTGALDVEALNGAVTVKRWDRPDVLVRARVAGSARSDAEARRLVRETEVTTRGGTVRARTPEARDGGTSVSYEIFAPQRTNLTVRAANGPVGVYGLEGTIRAEATNGPVSLDDVAGDVRVRATNGPVTVALGGSTWRGAGLDVAAQNGPITLTLPPAYSARLAARTENGGISTEGLQIARAARAGRRTAGDTLETTLGRGGPVLSLSASNGGIQVRPAR